MTPIYPTMQIAATRHVARIGSYQDLAAPRLYAFNRITAIQVEQ